MKRISAAILSIMAASAMADTNSNNGFYLGLGVSSVGSDLSYTDLNGNKNDIDFETAEIFGGYKLNPYVGGEVRIGSSMGGNNTIDQYSAIYYRVESANTVGKTYLLAGYGQADIKTNAAKYGNLDISGFSYGAGVGFIVNDRWNLNLEYRVLASGEAKSDLSPVKHDLKLSAMTVSVDYRFDSVGSSSSSNSDGPSFDLGGRSAPYIFGDIASTSLDIEGGSKSINGFDIGAGYKFNNTFALELAYRKLGSIGVSDEDGKIDTDISVLQFSHLRH